MEDLLGEQIFFELMLIQHQEKNYPASFNAE
jgi:hypothetical protein